MTTTVNCDTCSHAIICRLSDEARKLKARVSDELKFFEPAPLSVTISCPHYLIRTAFVTGLTTASDSIRAIPCYTTTSQEGYHA